MKEFDAQTGGRYTYVDDIVNLQELALALTSIFDDCDNFIISGCEISGNTISSGYVYINGKIRHFSGVSNIATWPQYLYENNHREEVAYASGDNKIGRNVYGCAITSEIPMTIDRITGNMPAFITITEQGGLKMNDAFFGKYTLLLQSATGFQTVNDAITFSKNINVQGALTTGGSVSIVSHQAQNKLFYSDNSLVVQSKVGNTTMDMKINHNDGFQFFINNNLLCTIGANEIAFKKPTVTTMITAGNICVESNNITNKQADNSGCININMTGYNNSKTYYRNTKIGDGKGVAIITVTGATKKVQIDGCVNIKSAQLPAFTLSGYTAMQWVDNNDAWRGWVGYENSNNSKFKIHNQAGSIYIVAADSVDIAPKIKENGVLLSEKYATQQLLGQQLAKKADRTSVYTKDDCDGKFLTQTNAGLIYLTKTEASNTYVVKDKLLSDIATNAERKKDICNNIGAVHTEDNRLTDTGWVQIRGAGCDKLYARQIGSTVCIQGKVTLYTELSNWTIDIPQTIAPPQHAVSVTYKKGSIECWTGWIEAKTRTIQTAYSRSVHGEEIPITITYMI